MLETSEVKFKDSNLEPYIELTYTTKLSLDQEMYMILAAHGERVEELIIDEFSQMLYQKLPGILKEHRLGYQANTKPILTAGELHGCKVHD